MALSPQEAADLNKQLQEIERLSRLLKKNIDTTSLKDIETHADTIRQLFGSLNEEFNDLTGEIGYAAANFKKLIQDVKSTNVGVNETTKTFNKLSSIAQKLQMHQKGISELTSDEVKKLQKQIQIEKEKIKTNQNILEDKKTSLEFEKNDIGLQIQQKLAEASQKRRSGDADGAKAAEKEYYKLKSEQARITKEHTRTTAAIKANKDLLEDQDESLKAIEVTAKGINDHLEKQEKLLGLGGAAVEGIDAALNKLGFGGLSKQLGLDDAKEKMKATADNIINSGGDINSMGNKMKVMQSGFSSMGKSLVGNITNMLNPVTLVVMLIKELVDALINSDKATGELAKNMNMTYDQASELRQEMNQIANLSMDAAVTTKGMQESYMAIGKSIGAQVDMNKANLVFMTQMREKAGLTNEEMMSMQNLAVTTGKDVEVVTEEFLGGAKAIALQSGKALNVKQLMQETSKVSNAIKLSIKGGAEGLGEAAAKAKLMGMNLEQADKIAGSLLNFEDSINAELEAELLTGKDLNLEAARLAAINGDMGKLTEEIAKNIGTSADFSKMNRLQQEALAKSVGMTREELANTLVEQEALKTLGRDLTDQEKEAYEAAKEKYGAKKAAAMLGKGELDNMMKQQSIQERFNQTIEKLREVFVSIADPLLSILSPLMDIVNAFMPLINLVLEPFMTGIRALAEYFKTFIMEPMEGLKEIFGGILKMFTGDFSEGLKQVGHGLIRAILAPIQAGLNMVFSVLNSVTGWINKIPGVDIGKFEPPNLADLIMADDMVSPGYGKRTILSPEGSIALNDNDTIVAGTDLGAPSPSDMLMDAVSNIPGLGFLKPSTGAEIQNMNAVIAEIRVVKDAILSLANQPINISIDGEKVGEKSAFGTNLKNQKSQVKMQ
jgi:5-bromo-4-chloroindolyl phosphate hydrolysis protein